MINSDSELEKYSNARLVGDYASADIYVMGAGLVNGSNYKSAEKMQAIKNFRMKYFQMSNANLVGWGQPDLLGSIR